MENSIKSSSYNHSFFNMHKKSYKNYKFSKPKDTSRPIIQNMEIYKERVSRVNIPGLSIQKVKIQLNETRDYQLKELTRRVDSRPNTNNGYLPRHKTPKRQDSFYREVQKKVLLKRDQSQ